MFFGREDQIRQLEALWDKRVSSFVTCRGRRRVGKSTLVEEFARRSGARFIKIEGVRPPGAWHLGLLTRLEMDPVAHGREVARVVVGHLKSGAFPPSLVLGSVWKNGATF